MLNQKPMGGKGETVLDIGDTLFRSFNIQRLPYKSKVKGIPSGAKKRRKPKTYKTVQYDSPRPDMYNFSPLGGVGMGKKPGSQLKNIMGGILREGKTLTAKQRAATAAKEKKRVAAILKRERLRNIKAEKERKASGANRSGWEIIPKDKDEVQERVNFTSFNTSVTELDDGYKYTNW